MTKQLDKFTIQYLETALWSSLDSNDNPLDQDFSINDFSDNFIDTAIKDCNSFREKTRELLDGHCETMAAHDFWLTRNSHGAGFWDGDYEKELGEKLTKISHDFGGIELVVGDDGKIYA